ncbi:MAG TPA: type III pantothenate kinase [bacterium]|nr:type III pantothenate kinase [bacterium]
MVYLVFDLGNSRVKLARVAEGVLGPVRVQDAGDFAADPGAALDEFEGISGALGVSTHPPSREALRGWLDRRGIEPASARERCPLAALYGEGLGDDRVLAAHAAVEILGAPVAAVGCGTAVTVDLVRVRDGEPVFAGGAILAGEGIILTGLGELRTLPELEPADAPIDATLGSTTEGCLRLGARVQVEAAVARLLAGYAENVGLPPDRLPLLFHGGDAQRYAAAYTWARVRPFAVLEALARMAAGL